MPPSARDFFSRRGILSTWHPNYEFREGQLEMAEAVEAAMAERRHLIVEAGTGTGKTLAYLIPAILSGRRIVISTGTKNLQEQLFFKDVPFLAQHFDRPLKVCYMKGRNNYLCRQKVYDAEREPLLSGLEEVTDFRLIKEWEPATETGDRAELKTLPEKSTLWPKLDARRDLCAGSKCQQFDRCFLTAMQRRAAESDIIIVNHHLFFADLALKQEEFAGVIPEYDAVIFDEAHEIEDVAGMYFGMSISNGQFHEFRRDLLALAHRKNFADETLATALTLLDDHVDRFFSRFEAPEGRTAFRRQAQFLEENEDVYRGLLRSCDLIGAHLQLVPDAPEELIPFFRRAQELRGKVEFWLESNDRGHVYWMERRGRLMYLQACPINVSGLLDEKLFDRFDTVVLTSATLAVGGKFDYVTQRLGLRQARSMIVEGAFDYPKQSILYVPPHLPDVRQPAFARAAADEIQRLLELSEGRAFVLFTSYQQMQQVYERLEYELDYPMLLQGTAPRTALLDEFRETPNAVLFATSSFWQGVDVQGDQLSCVIIDKLPFAVPSDPIVEARINDINENGGNAFYEYQIPRAALSLKQGFGRLIRSRTDRGVLALLDNRVTRQRYGKVFLDSLPPYRFTTNLEDVRTFFNSEEDPSQP